ncbi:MAG: YebC/PmpR family DNA-binding transcriptional regulator [Gammaproteobacteria bacterium]|nr:MAG: YebC/PmpR family DNA-binding transcriptional regulator [Gammaproteobacteria bacterium]
MAGHSKWANIQHRKGAQDKKRGKVFSKLIRELTIAARLGGSDPTANPRLRLAIDKARSQNLPKDTLERAIQRGAGRLDGAQIEEVTYEGYGPGGAAVMVSCLTDNRNRTVSEVRHVFARHGGNLGADGSVGYLFNRVGLLSFTAGTDEESLLAAALDAGAEDVVNSDDGSIEVLTDPADFEAVRDALAKLEFVPQHAEVTLRSAVSARLDPDAGAHMLRLLEDLDELDDVQNVCSNADIPEEVIARL